MIYVVLFLIFLSSPIIDIIPLLWFINLEVVLAYYYCSTEMNIALAVLICAASQVLGHGFFYWVMAVMQDRWTKFSEKVKSSKWNKDKYKEKFHYVIFAAGVIGLPPNGIAAGLCALMNIRFRTWYAISFLGRVIRFAIVIALADYIVANIDINELPNFLQHDIMSDILPAASEKAI